MSVVAVIVTHDAQAWIAETISSILDQTRRPDRIVIVDDHSTDATASIIRTLITDIPFDLITSATDARDVHTRIAANFVQAVHAARADIIVLGDHDDIWHRDRIERHLALFESRPGIAMVAADGRIFEHEESSVVQPGLPAATLRDSFPVPTQFNDWPASRKFRYAVRHSVATGGASAIRPALMRDLEVPQGWLHDRWWSLSAAAHNSLFVDPALVIDYRVSATQQVGLDAAAQGLGAVKWAARHLAQSGRSARRFVQLVPLFVASR